MVMQTCLMRISIHTSAREVTAVWVYQVRNGCEFQSTLPQGKWRRYTASARLPHDFNPHFRKGSDFCPTGIEVSYPTISIHTSAREVTHFFSFLSYDIYISIHTSAREVTIMYDIYYIGAQFQSTLPQGKWQPERSRSQWEIRFQSTLPQGKWQTARRERQRLQSFQSTLPQGKWRLQLDQSRVSWEFQSTLPQGKWRLSHII